ncbi:hypothetical protein V5G28_003715 [Scytonema sp. PRP1]
MAYCRIVERTRLGIASSRNHHLHSTTPVAQAIATSTNAGSPTPSLNKQARCVNCLIDELICGNYVK